LTAEQSVASPLRRFIMGCARVALMIPQRGDTLVVLVNAADQALYEAKHLGKNRAVAEAKQTQALLTSYEDRFACRLAQGWTPACLLFISTSLPSGGRVAQRESTPFTRVGS
jgi:hypothetical protein